MFFRLKNIARSALLGVIGLGIGGIVLGWTYSTDSDWLWLLGFSIFGVSVGAVLGLIMGGWRKLTNWALMGGLVFGIVNLALDTRQLEPVFQAAVIGAITGAFMGTAFGLYRPAEKKVADISWSCEECGSQVKEKDKSCPKCGAEFE